MYILLDFLFFRQLRKTVGELCGERESTEINQKSGKEGEGETKRGEQAKKNPVKYNNMKQLTKWNC